MSEGLVIGGYTVTARLDELGCLHVVIDAGTKSADLNQLCNLSESWTSNDALEVVFSTDRRLAIAEGALEDKDAEADLNRAIVEDLSFRAAFSALGTEARRLVRAALRAAQAQKVIADAIDAVRKSPH